MRRILIAAFLVIWAVLDLQYHRLFTDGSSPRWLIPGSIGLELR